MLTLMRNGGVGMWFLAVLSLVLLVFGILFARTATPQRLSIIRALTLALTFSTVTVFISDLIAVTSYCRNHPDDCNLASLVQGFGEACAPLTFGAGFLAIAWILVAVGVRRMPSDRT
jgi:hypothetical protein